MFAVPLPLCITFALSFRPFHKALPVPFVDGCPSPCLRALMTLWCGVCVGRSLYSPSLLFKPALCFLVATSVAIASKTFLLSSEKFGIPVPYAFVSCGVFLVSSFNSQIHPSLVPRNQKTPLLPGSIMPLLRNCPKCPRQRVRSVLCWSTYQVLPLVMWRNLC